MDSLGDRIKGYYESRCTHYLTRRTPVIIRLDGKAFHTYTKPLKNKFDANLINVMNLTAIKLCEEIQDVQVAYIQSDEISLLLHDYKEITSEVQELCFQQGYNWNDLSTSNKRGRCVVKSYYNVGDTTRSSWIIDNEIPEFTKDRNYIEKYYAINT
jgi:tRNA(His) 5'-end guanylyltransferase